MKLNDFAQPIDETAQTVFLVALPRTFYLCYAELRTTMTHGCLISFPLLVGQIGPDAQELNLL